MEYVEGDESDGVVGGVKDRLQIFHVGSGIRSFVDGSSTLHNQ